MVKTRARIDDGPEIIPDGGSVKVPMFLMDTAQRGIAAARVARRTPGTQVVTDALGGAARLHQPGARFLSGSAGRVVADAKNDPRSARSVWLKSLNDAWRRPVRLDDDLPDEVIQQHVNQLHALGSNLIEAAGQDDDSDSDDDSDDDDVQDARGAYVRHLKDAWRMRDAVPMVRLEYGPQRETGGPDSDAAYAASKRVASTAYLRPQPGYCAQFDPAVIRQALALASVNPMLGPPLTSASTPPMSETESGRYVEKLIAARNRKEQNTADALKVRCQQLENSWRTDPTAASKIERQREKWTDE
jgi:hypothetical protein